MDYYEIAKTAYCTEGDQWDCRCCEMCEYLENHNFDSSACKEKLIIELVKIIDEYKKFVGFLTTSIAGPNAETNGTDEGHLVKAVCRFCGKKHGSLEEARKCEARCLNALIRPELKINKNF